MSAREDLLHEYGQADTAPLGTLADLRRKLDAHRAEVLREAAAVVGNDDTCDCGGCDTCVPRELAARLLEMAEGKSSRPAADATPDFFQPGHTYAQTEYPQHDWRFRCDTVTTHPEDGERTALGWRFWRGNWEAYAYGEDDWEIHLHVGLTDVTGTEAAR